MSAGTPRGPGAEAASRSGPPTPAESGSEGDRSGTGRRRAIIALAAGLWALVLLGLALAGTGPIRALAAGTPFVDHPQAMVELSFSQAPELDMRDARDGTAHLQVAVVAHSPDGGPVEVSLRGGTSAQVGGAAGADGPGDPADATSLTALPGTAHGRTLDIAVRCDGRVRIWATASAPGMRTAEVSTWARPVIDPRKGTPWCSLI